MNARTAPPAPAPAENTATNLSELRELRALICERVAVDLRRDGVLPQDEVTRFEVRRRVDEFLQSSRPNFPDAMRISVVRDRSRRCWTTPA